MAYPASDEHRSYMRVYMLARYRQRRQDAVQRLGGKCCMCGSLERLELDHIDRSTKALEISKMWSVSKARFEAEVVKCQVLCRECHAAKTLVDLGRVSAKTTHGTVSSYRYCKCPACKAAKSAANRATGARRLA
jgi:hypothetical protein